MLKLISTLLLINLASNSASVDIDIKVDIGPSSGTPDISLNEKSNESPVLQEKSTGNNLWSLKAKALKAPEGSSQPPQCVAQDGICQKDSECCKPEEMYCEESLVRMLNPPKYCTRKPKLVWRFKHKYVN